MRLAIVGSSGFIGKNLLHYLGEREEYQGIQPVPIVRRAGSVPGAVVASLRQLADPAHSVWREVDTLLYLTGVAHNKAGSDLTLFEQVNHVQMMDVMMAAQQAGVRKIIYLSSIGVHGDHQQQGAAAWDEGTVYAPYNAYTVSKVHAEQSLLEDQSLKLDVAIVRPPLVYGRDAPANFQMLRRLVLTGLPLPFGRIRNRRSFIGIRNLADMLATLALRQSVGRVVYTVSDGSVIDTTSFVGAMQRAAYGRALLVPIPARLIAGGLVAVGRRQLYTQLWGDLELNINRVQRDLHWHPPFTWQQEVEASMSRNVDR